VRKNRVVVGRTQHYVYLMILKRDSYLLKGYCRSDRIIYGTGQIVKSVDLAQAASRMLDHSDVNYVHVRSALNNCFSCRIDRVRSEEGC
jgi:hypothetical protein